MTQKADAKGVARFAVYGTNASKPSAYLGTYSVKSSDPKVSGAFEVVSKVSSGDDGKPGSNDDGDSGSDNGNGGSDNGSGSGNGNGSDNGSGSDGGNGGSRLPRTGAELGALGLGAGLLAIGGVSLMLTRRRRG